MGRSDQDINLRIKGQNLTGPAFKSARKDVKRLGRDAGQMKSMLAGALSGVAVASFARSSVQAYEEQANAVARLGGVLRATGEAAGFSERQLTHMAASLQKVTTYSDQAVMGSQAILLTFKNIKGANFERALESVLDLSAAMGQELRASAIQLGKALENPIKGMGALAEVGVSFTKAQETRIKNLVRENKLFEAQTVLLKTIEGQTKGTAGSLANTPAGQLAKMKNELKDHMSEVGGEVVRALSWWERGTRGAAHGLLDANRMFENTPGHQYTLLKEARDRAQQQWKDAEFRRKTWLIEIADKKRREQRSSQMPKIDLKKFFADAQRTRGKQLAGWLGGEAITGLGRVDIGKRVKSLFDGMEKLAKVDVGDINSVLKSRLTPEAFDRYQARQHAMGISDKNLRKQWLNADMKRIDTAAMDKSILAEKENVRLFDRMQAKDTGSALGAGMGLSRRHAGLVEKGLLTDSPGRDRAGTRTVKLLEDSVIQQKAIKDAMKEFIEIGRDMGMALAGLETTE